MEHRPYRSHKVPACARCRQRKIRCKIDLPGQPCLFCRDRGVVCQIPTSPLDSDAHAHAPPSDTQNRSLHPAKRRRYDAEFSRAPPASATLMPSSLSGSNAGGNSKSTVIVSPAVAEDVEIVQRHMSRATATTATASSQHPDGDYATEEPGGTSVVYVTVPKYRRGVKPKPDTGDKQREIIEQIFGPFKKEAIRLYFELVHPCFPIVGDELRAQLLGPRWQDVNSALLCNIYASIVPLWDSSEILRLHPRPDSDYVWNLAVSALQEDSTSPSFSTILLCGINVIGRPSLYYVGNIANSSRAVALAHSFGLHRDPRRWDKPLAEKEMRVRLWWCVFIIDSWSSLSYGTPPNITKGCYDVRLPEAGTAARVASSVNNSPKNPGGQSHANGNGNGKGASQASFYALCSLTRILAEMLPMVYHLDPDPAAVQQTLGTTAAMLAEWEGRAGSTPPESPGRIKDYSQSNLRFCHLSVKLLFNRLSLRVAWLQAQNTTAAAPANLAAKAAISTRLLGLQISATKVLEFVTTLTPEQLREFWLPYTAHLLVVATMILLRCAVETENQASKAACVATLTSLKDALEAHRDNHAWELGELCLERCAELISRVQGSSSAAQTPAQVPMLAAAAVEDADGAMNVGAEEAEGLQFLDGTSLMPFDPLGGFDAIDDIWHSLFGSTGAADAMPVQSF
ncbi:hypothetical protein DRE_02193 [Drechslerella stenobrocha 248]|uniref:Zn(2)-C6 fungal-type domain-containing protein n=1 Tax=Drechslerella stenobrocha 248 TaxID=1043628 RepID=W7HY37_9PEZI|nr:hypothetical protein DRE_02193 [Drechslerella stenobrocha 248]